MITKTPPSPPEPHAPARVADSAVLHLSAWWLALRPWVWRCPTCTDVLLRGDTEDDALTAARKHCVEKHC